MRRPGRPKSHRLEASESHCVLTHPCVMVLPLDGMHRSVVISQVQIVSPLALASSCQVLCMMRLHLNGHDGLLGYATSGDGGFSGVSQAPEAGRHRQRWNRVPVCDCFGTHQDLVYATGHKWGLRHSHPSRIPIQDSQL